MDAPTILYVLRHAHAAKPVDGQRDRDRPLDGRGAREAEGVGRTFADHGFAADLILCSPALRTRQTLDGLGSALADVETVFEDRLYPGDTAAYLALLATLGERRSVLIIGHNPAVAELVAALAGGGEPDALRRHGERVPPGSLARLEFSGPLATVGEGDGRLSHFLVPPKG